MKKILDFLNKDFVNFEIRQNNKINKGKEKPSGFFRRFGATLTDIFFFSFLISVLAKYNLIAYPDGFLVFLIFPLYGAICSYFLGMTLGKCIFGIKLVKEGGEKITIYSLIRREYVFKPISMMFFGFGILRMFFDKRKQTYYDRKLKLEVVVWRNDWMTYLFIFATALSLIFETFIKTK